MEVKKFRLRNFLILGAIGLGLIPIAVLGLNVFMAATKKPLHPDANAVPSEMRVTPAADWTATAEHARQLARAHVAVTNLPGMSVAVGIGGQIVWAEGFGWSNLDDKSPVLPDTRFLLGTASTALTSAAAGVLIEQGKLKLDDEIQKAVPSYPKKEWPLTLRQVMAHTGGVPSDGGDESPMFHEHCDRAADGLPFFNQRALRFEPDTHYSFSNFGWVLVSAAMEAAGGESFAKLMRQLVLEPLDLKDTKVLSGNAPIAGMASAYFPQFRGDPTYGLDPLDWLNLSCYAGSSALVSTPSDLVRFAMAINAGKLLKPETVQMMQKSQRLRSGEETGYGLGWDLETATIAGKPTAVIGHDGDILAGQAATLVTLPEHGITISVIANTSYADTYALALKIAEVFVYHRAG